MKTKKEGIVDVDEDFIRFAILNVLPKSNKESRMPSEIFSELFGAGLPKRAVWLMYQKLVVTGSIDSVKPGGAVFFRGR